MLFGNPNIKYFNELEINGKNVNEDEDYTEDLMDPDEDDETEEVETADEGGDDLADFTEDEFDGGDDSGSDETEQDEETADGDDLADFTEDEFDDDTETDEAEQDEEAEDANETEEVETADEGGDDSGTDDTGGDEGGDDLADFTEDEFDGGDDSGSDDAGDTGGDEGGDAEGDDSGEESADNNEGNDNEESADNNDNTLAGMEKNLFSDLSPQQLVIKNNELLQNYIKLYETINTIFDSINKIPKTFDNTRPLSFIADQLVELKDMVNYIITTTYITRTYVENMTYYKQALVVLEQLNSMLKALIQKPSK